MPTIDVNDRLGKGGYNGVAAWRTTNGSVEGLILPNGNVVKIPTLVSQSYSPVTRSSNNTTDNTYQTIYTVTVPANTMNYNGKIVIEQDWKYTNSASGKNLRIDWGGQWMTAAPVSTSDQSWFVLAIKNTNSLSSQIALNGVSFSSGGAITTSVDTTQDVAIDFRCNWGTNVVGETITLLGYSIWYYPGNT